jgi:ATP-dependent RNA helicase SUPV3L1/SUV3
LPQPEASSEGEAAAAPQAVVEATTETSASETAVTEVAATDAGAEAAAPEVAAVPEMVEVWRPGGRSDDRRPRHDRSRHRPNQRSAEGAAPVAATGEPGEAPKHERHRRGRRERNNEFRKPRTDAPPAAADGTPAVAADGAPASPPREDRRPPRERFAGKGKEGDKGRDGDRPKGKFEGRDKGGRDKGGRDRDKGGGRDSGPSHRPWATSAAPRERDRPADPNSPFAKLAALKDQLAATRKDG